MIFSRGKIIHILAISVIILGIISTIYVNAYKEKNNSSNEIIINGNSFDISIIFSNINEIKIITDDGEKSGIPLDQLIDYSGENCPSCFKYQIIGSDGYKQTVNWQDMENGVISLDRIAFFPHLAHSFWVRDIIEIEVKKI